MTRVEFLDELKRLLQDLPAEERDEAIEFYDGYFEDAGPENEQSIIVELISPARVAAKIRAELEGNVREEEIVYTETGYEDPYSKQDKYAVADQDKRRKNHSSNKENTAGENSGYHDAGARNDSHPYGESGREQGTNNNMGAGKILLIILLVMFAIPVGFPLLGAGLGILVSIFAVLFCFILISFILMVVFLAVGVGLIFGGFASLFVMPFNGILLIGGGLILLGLGLLSTRLFVWVVAAAIPAVIRGIVNGISSLFHGRRTAQ
ncbi:DUF1700 domain-containing protein [Anaerolentibacter hominis]|uniref:DUF1700 domain-containing protein n=1 Tax=Anaerolentibacter hominis TaxID=3079009 RepID=UPI0031B80902